MEDRPVSERCKKKANREGKKKKWALRGICAT
jgi:hypothetical protein